MYHFQLTFEVFNYNYAFHFPWEPKSLVLATVKFSVEHTAEHIAAELIGVTNHWVITHKVEAIVTDIRIMPQMWSQQSELQIHCFVHTLNFAVQEAIKMTQK